MKKLLLISLLPIIIFSQTQNKSIAELKQQITTEVDQDYSLQLQTSPEKKKAGLAIIYSLILPGMGELYADAYDSGIYFTVADAIFWGGVAGLNIYGNWKEDSYRSFAQSNGKANLDGKDEKYFADIGIYTDIYQYNKVQELSRNFDAIYDESTHFWQWKDNAQRSEYRQMWTSSENAFNNVRFAVGALILNRVVSAINAVRMVSAYNKRIEEDTWNVSVGMTTNPNLPTSINLNFITKF
ncbi:MAG: hypothetical protein QY331_04155 [Melioribacteraceae bacterium]|jgi:hypothetical protein|nr:hypothetical protein [Melioribacteraceae bacterium]RJP60929.1 MAG: hypothetical protein C4543_04200 [Ignavibacteriales bacterium]WKZ70446.1 MAG: hypothetical protein QY331_04155 [Melioribacteraceae bacterium]